jgi:hypothetical protein
MPLNGIIVNTSFALVAVMVMQGREADDSARCGTSQDRAVENHRGQSG